MAQEIEIKFLDIDRKSIEEKLVHIGAQKSGDFFYRSTTFDFPGFPLDTDASWVRLRNEGDKVTCAYKKRLGTKSHDGTTQDSGMEEVEVIVDSFDEMSLFLKKIGMVEKFVQEKKRTRYVWEGIEFDIDEWPRIPLYIEIEAKNEIDLARAARTLGFDMKDAKICSATQIYKLYNINDIEYQKMTFDEFVKRVPVDEK